MSHRNIPCPCGSGRKYKVCCAARRPRKTRWVAASAIAAFVVVAGWVVSGALLGDGGERQLPEGWVWSEEHGHAHQVGSQGFVEPPPDAVWVPEHGHFHDAAGNAIGGETSDPSTPPSPGS